MIEQQELCLVRVSPGDNWKEADDVADYVGDAPFSSLTEGLEHIFQRTGVQEYRISAGKGKVYSLTYKEETPTPTKTYSLYGDE